MPVGAGRRRLPADPCPARQVGRPLPFPPMPPTPSGYVPGAPIISTEDLHEGLTRLQAGQTDFDVGGANVAFSGIPQGMHNVLRDLQESPLGRKANQIESMTIEMVAMLFDFIFDTQGPAGRHQGAAGAAADPGAEGGDARRRVLRQEVASVAAAGQRAGAGGTGLVAGHGPGRSAVQEDRARSSTRSSTTSPTISRSSTSSASSWKRSWPRKRRPPRRTSSRRPRKSTSATASRSPRSSRRPRSSGGSRRIRCRISWRRSCARTGRARSSTSTCNDGEESEAWGSGSHDARGPRLERAAQALAGGPPAPGGAAAVAAQAAVGRHAQPGLAAGRARDVHGQPRRGARGGGEAVAGRDRSPTAAVAEAAKVQAEMAKAAGDDDARREGRGAGRGDDAGRSRSRSSPSAKSSTTTTWKSRAAWNAACGSSSRPTTASSRSRSSRG